MSQNRYFKEQLSLTALESLLAPFSDLTDVQLNFHLVSTISNVRLRRNKVCNVRLEDTGRKGKTAAAAIKLITVAEKST